MGDYLNPQRDDWDAITAEYDDKARHDSGWKERFEHWLSSSACGRLYAALREGPKSTAELKALGFESPGRMIGHLRRSSIVQDNLNGQINLVEFDPLTPNGKSIRRYALFDDDTPEDFLYYGVPSDSEDWSMHASSLDLDPR